MLPPRSAANFQRRNAVFPRCVTIHAEPIHYAASAQAHGPPLRDSAFWGLRGDRRLERGVEVRRREGRGSGRRMARARGRERPCVCLRGRGDCRLPLPYRSDLPRCARRIPRLPPAARGEVAARADGRANLHAKPPDLGVRRTAASRRGRPSGRVLGELVAGPSQRERHSHAARPGLRRVRCAQGRAHRRRPARKRVHRAAFGSARPSRPRGHARESKPAFASSRRRSPCGLRPARSHSMP